jgi:hypothetical protein
MKRVVLFLATNIAVLVVLGIVLQLLGVDSLLDGSSESTAFSTSRVSTWISRRS